MSPHHTARLSRLFHLGLVALLIGGFIHGDSGDHAGPSLPAIQALRPPEIRPHGVRSSRPASSAIPHAPVVPTIVFTMTGTMAISRVGHSATLLPNGHVLVVGGDVWIRREGQPSAELYNPLTGTFTATSPLRTDREWHTATLLPTGQVLIAGGWNRSLPAFASAELYNPATGRFTPSGNLRTGRLGHTATLLPDGQVLLVGGIATGFPALASAELFNPTTGIFTPTGSLTYGRAYHTATLLTNGTVLIAGGEQSIPKPDGTPQVLSVAHAEVYEPKTRSFRVVGSLLQDHDRSTATLLPNGQVLVVGGIDWPQNQFLLTTAELYNPASESFIRTGSLRMGREDHTATLLPNGRVLIVGGSQITPCPFAEIYDLATGLFTRTEISPTNRFNHRATRLLNGTVLITGGSPSVTIEDAFASAELVYEGSKDSMLRNNTCHEAYLPVIGH